MIRETHRHRILGRPLIGRRPDITYPDRAGLTCEPCLGDGWLYDNTISGGIYGEANKINCGSCALTGLMPIPACEVDDDE